MGMMNMYNMAYPHATRSETTNGEHSDERTGWNSRHESRPRGRPVFHRPNAMMAAADDPKSEGLSSRVNFVASSGTSKTTTHCSGGPCSADSAHVCFFLVLGLDARINHPGVFIVGVRLLVSSSISAIHCCPHLSKLRLWKSS